MLLVQTWYTDDDLQYYSQRRQVTPEEKARREKALEHPQSKEQEDIKHAANELDCCCLCSVVGEKKTKKKDRERERKLLLIRFASFLGSLVLKTNESTHSAGTPTRTQDEDEVWNELRSDVLSGARANGNSYKQRERKERARKREARKRIVSYPIFCCRFLPSSDWNTQTQSIRTLS